MPASFVLCAKELSSEEVSDGDTHLSDAVIVPVAGEAVPFSWLCWIQLVLERVFDVAEANESLCLAVEFHAAVFAGCAIFFQHIKELFIG